MTSEITWKDRWKRVFFFFPFQLVLVHLHSNQLLLVFWLFLGGVATGTVASNLGAQFLFLFPEYMGSVSPLSHFLLGLTLGGFIMAFQISSYILNGSKFAFLATLRRPFTKYVLNNSIIPLFYLVLHITSLYHYQATQEFIPKPTICLHIISVLAGVFAVVFVVLSYFLTTNKSLQKLFGDLLPNPEKRKVRAMRSALSKREKWYTFLGAKKQWKVHTYLQSPWEVKLPRNIEHYDAKMLQTVFAQNHINASVFEIFIIFIILFLGTFRGTSFLELPAGASLLLLFTMVLMIVSAAYSWLKGWAVISFIALLFLYNEGSKISKYSFTNYAYGLSYETPSEYSNERLQDLANNTEILQEDLNHHREILEKWHAKNTSLTQLEKPKLIVFNCSGGGLRSSLWTMHAMSYLDSVLDGTLMDRTHLITGASGGMLGSAYYRQLYLEDLENQSTLRNEGANKANISKDLLNAVGIDIALHDWFFRWNTFEQNGHVYTKDRAYSWEQQLNENTEGALNNNLAYYKKPESESQIPLMVMSPYVVNDGRRLITASQPVSFLSKTAVIDNLHKTSHVESVELQRLIPDGDQLSMLSALRMNASYFYVLPQASLPTHPEIQVMDAGIRDNLGLYNAIRYINAFEDWLNENTSGIIIVQLRDTYNAVQIAHDPQPSFITSLVSPFNSLYRNYLAIQSFDQEEMMVHASTRLKERVSVVNLQMKRSKEENISLSWHLTEKEKKQVLSSINSKENQESIQTLIKLIQPIQYQKNSHEE